MVFVGLESRFACHSRSSLVGSNECAVVMQSAQARHGNAVVLRRGDADDMMEKGARTLLGNGGHYPATRRCCTLAR